MFSTTLDTFGQFRQWISSFYAYIFRLYVYLMLPIYRRILIRVFALGDIQFNGDRPWDIRTKNDNFFLRMMHQVIGFDRRALGETYMDGDWECDQLDQCIERVMRRGIWKGVWKFRHNRIINFLSLAMMNSQTKTKAVEVAEQHYDLGNDLFEGFLDKNMNYTCGYWRNADNLNDAQVAKMKLIGDKLNLKPGMRVLDIGCGWGGLCKYLAENYDVEVVGVSISKEQIEYGQRFCKDPRVTIRFQDYRDINEKFDRICSVGMVEHVGHHNYKTFFKGAHRCLKDDGIFLLHTIGVNHKQMPRYEPWVNHYIFPNGELPYYKQITQHMEGLFILEDWQNFGVDYSKTLKAWDNNFRASWPKLKGKYSERFFRMWTFYLNGSCGSFRARKLQLWQVVMTKHGLPGGYYAPK